MANYTYDFFFSYKRDEQSDSWHQTFLEKLEYYVGLESGEKPNVFFDKTEIANGDQWQEIIVDALKTSKCLVGLWSPLYFNSKWCISESYSFMAREEQLDIKKGALIISAHQWDGESFPEKAKARQGVDVSPYTSTLSSFWESKKATDLEKIIKDFAKDVANKIKKAPNFQEDFPVKIFGEHGLNSIGRVSDSLEQ